MSAPTNLSYDIGDAVPLVYTISQAATVVLTVTDPDGVTSTPGTTQGVGPPATPGGPATVTYTANVPATKAGPWRATFVATGTVTDTEEQIFIVRRPVAADIYCTIGQILEQAGADADNLPEPLLRRAVQATSRAIDRATGRRFWPDLTPTIRLYRPRSHTSVITHDIATTTGLAVATDEAGNGTYSTIWAPSDYQLEPLDAAADGEPWWLIRAVGDRRFPVRDRRRATLQVTARFGWLTIPDDVNQAAILKATKLFKRRESPDGFASGMGEYGPVRISRYEDPDAWLLLGNVMRYSTPET
ncbi:MAG TPA: hypothetical protein VG276_27905 [Actinomycetes bacterium]|jgi:hypothetical protein|nr:hypothetical protein [Actinomycetes bacterium]